jgi:cytochrome b subunit of formate dehydrogenase
MKESYKRFSTGRIAEHLFQMVIFTVLVATGLSQKFYSFDVSIWFILKCGGIDTVRFIHRAAGIVFSMTVAVHVVGGAVGIAFKQWQPSMMITGSDFMNAVHNVKYYLGMESRPAKSGKYNYTQKFEYWGIVSGAFIMILSGGVLWKPVFVTQFAAGEIIPLAKVLHSNEALVVFLIIAGWHIYNSIFSPEVFPLNLSIFTGSITRERMAHDHILELARLENKSSDAIWEEMQKLASAKRCREGLKNPDR